MFAKRKKYEFYLPQVQFLGHVIRQAVAMKEKKVTAIMDCLRPCTLKEMQRFLGIAIFYHRFIRNFSQVAAPLTSHLSWPPGAAAAFVKLKKTFCLAPILAQPRPNLPFEVEIDASEAGVGAVLIQHDPQTRRRHPCAYYSQ